MELEPHYFPRKEPDYSAPLFTANAKLWAAIIAVAVLAIFF